MRDYRQFMKVGAAVAALGLAGAGGYVARAGVGPDGAVNAHPLANAGAPASFADIIQHVAPAVVSIEVEGKLGPQHVSQSNSDDEDGGEGSVPPQLRRFFQQSPEAQQPSTPMRGAGSGFFISPDGYIVTNNHVIEGADKITIHMSDDRTLKARVVGHDQATDIAVLKVETTGAPFVSFEDRAKPRVGDWVVAVGNPFNLGGTATAGIISALGRHNVSGSSYVDYMQIDAPINRGNSGGPTFDLYGRVVGVNTAIYSPSGGSVGIGFDIPADVVASVSRQLIANGKVTRGYIGAAVQDVTPDIAESLGIAKSGALVGDVTPGGPSDTAGVKSGDLILKVDGHAVTGAADLTRQVGTVRAGDTIHLEVLRNGQTRDVAVRSGVRPSEDQMASNGSSAQAPAEASTGVLGLRVVPDSQGRGVRVAGLSGDSDAAQKGLRTGDLIVQAGQAPTRTPAELARAVSQARESGRHQVLLLVARGGQHVFVPVELGAG